MTEIGEGRQSMPSEAQGKTKAKKRYLRRKKERRKHKKAATSKGDKNVKVAESSNVTDSEEEEEEQDSVVTDSPVVRFEGGEGSQKTSEGVDVHDERPKKRRKVDQSEDAKEATPHEHSPEPLTSEVTDRLKSPLPALPSFPLPIHPNAPSKRDLALQGLDPALVHADIVDSSTVLPIADGEEDESTGLTERTRKRLKDLGISELFAVQTALLPFLLPPDVTQRSLYLSYAPPRDVCVSAPTGSGKTLAYVLPIVDILSSRIVTRLRALVVLPTRDLVTQVRETFEAVSKGRGLKIGTATGQHSFTHEQTQLIADGSTRLQGGSSKVDILICTPGRLIDHLNGTPNFSLQHLRFLVIDEADRLLAQTFQGWLAQVLSATRTSHLQSLSAVDGVDRPHHPSPDALSPVSLHLSTEFPEFHTDLDEKKESSCQKLLFSATLTRDPGKIAALELRDPRYFIVKSGAEKADALDVVEKFTIPATLKEQMIVCDSAQKPLMLFYLVYTHNVTNALVFTKSAESTTRLVRLFEFFQSVRQPSEDQGEPRRVVIQSYSSDSPPSERKSLLERFKGKEIHILVASDLISRGIDISHVSHVVSYDVPVDMRKYVHRVGRTARAGRMGEAWTLVEEQEARYFKSMLKVADHLEKVKRLRVSEKDLAPLLPSYELALRQLKEAYSRP
ncbi:hypothetical protein JAAARDRAFT_178816 [Jaapia argillacea MUCL 33604]|uniref:ATP-dependent RNA helicase n=1 Tax=Jaapia argillacea MUCL 33604 TaxID=933084 RepID=A0A067Q132_9AGAM|nr:hypothetical protein JAAARDRAFT_178816 [Jaapia argillacea MUCL 33604]